MRRIIGALLLLVPLAAGCGGSAENADGADRPATGSRTIEAANGTVTLPAAAGRIVSLSPTGTEMLFAIGAGERVVAADDYSTYPEEAPRTELSSYQPNAEAVAGYKPDLVVLSNDQNGILAALEKLKIPVLLEPAAARLDDSYDQITDLGAATGHEKQAADLVADMKKRIDAAVKAAPDGTGLTYYHELDTSLYTVTSKTFVGQVYSLFGLENIADAADKQGGGYPQLSAEALLEADPGLIFLSHPKGTGESADSAAKRPGWSGLSAVKDGNVFTLDDDVASRWGPRLPDLIEDISAAVEQAA
ncbi:ABC transporter substrate-binding protein [Actinocorallia populi]|uniref:ABC transporter substrate-binding protein n=1 Tax=Actinocorallia populi TaxID=2079200 RepID=UPI000D0909A0|nr:ABC transporter substrate-binding protein [Actinocorallia populi]